MPQGLNKVLLIGNLGHEPELRYTQSDQAVLSLSLATNERYKTKNGEWKDQTEWHKVVIWNKRAEGLAKILHKGSQMFVEGKLQTRLWEDKDGHKRYTTEIVARNVILLGSKNGGGGRGEGAPPPGDDDYYGGSGYQGGGYSGGNNYVDDDDVPF